MPVRQSSTRLSARRSRRHLFTGDTSFPRLLPATAVALALLLLIPVDVRAQSSWETLSSGTTASFRGLQVVNDKVIWASGSRGTILRSTDGGGTWHVDSIPGAGKLEVRAIHARSAKVAHAASITGRIWRTVDGGQTWSLQYQATDTSVFLDALSFWDDRHGVALGDPMNGRFFILTTSDGGDSWQEAPLESRPIARDGEAAFAASGTSLVLLSKGVALIGSGGMAARVHRSNDGGKSWTATDVPIQSGARANGIFSLAFQNPSTGVAVGGNYRDPDSTNATAAVTRDGGVTWQPSTAMPSGYRSGAALSAKGSLALAVGTNGTDVSFDGGVSWASLNKQGFNSVQISPNGTAFAVGDRGSVARLDTHALTKK